MTQLQHMRKEYIFFKFSKPENLSHIIRTLKKKPITTGTIINTKSSHPLQQKSSSIPVPVLLSTQSTIKVKLMKK